MNQSASRFHLPSKPTPIWLTIVFGTLLGTLATLASSVLFACLLAVLGWWQEQPIDLGLAVADYGLILRFMAIGVLLIFVYAVLPGGIGGGVIALALRRLARHGNLRTTPSLIVGSLVGACAGCVTLYLAREVVQEYGSSVTVTLAVPIAALAGLAHSWLFRRWLRARLTRSVR